MEGINFHDVLSHPFSILRSFGYWFDKSATKLYKFYGICVHFVVLDLFAACQFIYVYNTRSLKDLTEILTIACTYFVGIIKTVRFILKVNQIIDLVEELTGIVVHMQAVENTEMPKYRARLKQVKTTFQFYWLTCVVASLAVPIIPLSGYLSNPNPPYQIPYPSWSPFNHENNFYGFLILSIYESLSGVAVAQMGATLDFLPGFFFNAAAGLIEELGDRLSRIRPIVNEGTGNVEDKNLKLIEKYIEIHLEIKACLAKSQNVFSPMIFTQAAISLVILCTTAYNLSIVSNYSRNGNFNVLFILFSCHQLKIPLLSFSICFIWLRWLARFLCLATSQTKLRKLRPIFQQAYFIQNGLKKASNSRQR